MSKRDELIEKYVESMNKMGLDVDKDFLTKVTVGLGPSIYNADASTVSCSDQTELQRVIDNFLVKKLGCEDSQENMMAAVKDVCATMGTGNRTKFRAIFYYLLAKKYNKESIYNK